MTASPRGFDLAGARHFARTRLGETGNTVADEALRLLADACDEVERLQQHAATIATRPLTDAELSALAAIVAVQAVQMAGDNAHRERNGEGPAWGSDCGPSDA